MKRILGLVSIMILGLFLVTGCSKVNTSKYFDDYKTMNLEESLTEEKIDHDLSSYKEDDKQVTIYLFRGRGCTHCRAFLTFLNSIVPEYGKNFKVVSYEVWYDKDNGDLLDKVSTYLGQPATGVPFIVIGDQAFGGYGERYNDTIKKTITDLYNSGNKYDVFEEIEKAEIKEKVDKLIDNTLPAIICSVVVIIIVIIIICNNNKRVMVRVNNLEKELKEIKLNLKEEVKETKEEVKKETKKAKKTVKKDSSKKTKQ